MRITKQKLRQIIKEALQHARGMLNPENYGFFEDGGWSADIMSVSQHDADALHSALGHIASKIIPNDEKISTEELSNILFGTYMAGLYTLIEAVNDDADPRFWFEDNKEYYNVWHTSPGDVMS